MLARQLGHVFAQPALLQQALTHRSFSADHNERLEFLGDSVLNLAVSSLLYERLPQAPEGDLSRIRANLVKQDSLHRIALKLDLSPALRLGEGELRSGGLKRPSILADALEAVLGAVYLDAGYAVAEALVHRLFADVDVQEHAQASGKDAKTALQEWLQARKYAVPQYQVTDVGGQAHQQTFWVVCEVAALGIRQSGSGSSRRAAEQDAAGKMLAQLQTNHVQPETARKKPANKARKMASLRSASGKAVP
ncbi:MAG: ribonuclease III [Brachymonas sp.]|nr:ribonuclease III [Brachymonas sp.]